MKVGDVLVVRDPAEIEKFGVNTEDLYEGDEYTVLSVGDKFLTVCIAGKNEDFTLEPSVGVSWKSFFKVKEL